MPIEVSPAFSPSNYVSMIWGRLWYWHSRQIIKAEEAYRAYRIGQDIATVRKNTVWSDVFHLASFYSFCFATAVQAFLNLPQLRFTYFFIDSFPCFISVSLLFSLFCDVCISGEEEWFVSWWLWIGYQPIQLILPRILLTESLQRLLAQE